jgi:GWxTD domain-containing protein
VSGWSRAVGQGAGRQALLLGLLLTVTVPAASGPLPPGRGDLSFHAQSYSEPAAAGLTRLLLVLEFPVPELAWRQDGDSLRAQLACRWSLHALGREAAAVDEQLEFSRAATPPLASMLYLRSVELPPGEYRLELECRDEGRRIGGVAGLFGRAAQTTLSTTLIARDFGTGGLGDPLLFQAPIAGARGALSPGGLFAHGAPAVELETAFAPPRSAQGAYIGLRLTLWDGSGILRFEKEGGWKYEAGVPLPLSFRVPLAELPPGDYDLRLEARGPEIDSTAVTCGLRILGEARASAVPLAQQAIEAQLFLSSDEFARWQRLPEGERAVAMADFWKRHDPDPATEENAVYDEFQLRFATAQERFPGFKPGALSDRGRILIRLGEPASVEGETMPLNRTGLSNAVRGLHGEAEVEPGISAYGVDLSQDDSAARSGELARDLSTIGTGSAVNFGDDSEPYEVWTYEFGGAPLLAEQRLHLRRPSLQLIFVDRSGTGDYTLAYRSEDFDF